VAASFECSCQLEQPSCSSAQTELFFKCANCVLQASRNDTYVNKQYSDWSLALVGSMELELHRLDLLQTSAAAQGTLLVRCWPLSAHHRINNDLQSVPISPEVHTLHCRSCLQARTKHKRLQLVTCQEWCSASA
jgi:hypothetical protein